MSPIVQEWLNLVFRWIHVMAAIMWIGDSFLFMWLDTHLTGPLKARDGDVVGELWMTHSGGFYEVIKRKSLAKNELPPKLYWFKWESYTTWITGFLLLIIVFHVNGAALLIDPSVMPLLPWQAGVIGLGVLPVAYGLYELLWLTPLKDRPRVFAGVGLVLVTALAYGLTQVFSARGAFLQVGATLGTIMVANVFFRIIPAQKHMLAMTREGKPVDTRYGLRAKGRSIQNHYLTLPVLFAMLSNHFPSTYGSKLPWLVLALLFVFGAGLKYVMNRRHQAPLYAAAVTLAALFAAIVLTHPLTGVDEGLAAYQNKPHVSFATAEAIVKARCVTCHSPKPSTPMFAGPPQGVTFDTPANILRHKDRMFIRAVATKTMPLGNMTGMTQEERDLLGAWIAQGADIHAQGPVQVSIAAGPAAAGTPHGGPASAKTYFKQVCLPCHGPQGMGNGPASAALHPKPRNFTDVTWQKSVTDDHIRQTILGGGPSVGKSDLMPANPGLETDRATLDGLVRIVRGFGKAAPK